MREILVQWTFIYGPLAVFLVGVYGLLTQKNLIKMAVSINIMDLGVNLFIISLGYVPGGKVPIYVQGMSAKTLFTDPLPQAMVLTSIVISVAVTAFVLALTIKINDKFGSVDLSELGGVE